MRPRLESVTLFGTLNIRNGGDGLGTTMKSMLTGRLDSVFLVLDLGAACCGGERLFRMVDCPLGQAVQN
jgi:hypothetical protein